MTNVTDLLAFLNELQVINDIIEHSENIIFAKDLDGRYTLANDASIKYFEKTKDEVIGKTDNEILLPAEADYNHKMDRLVMETGKKQSYEKERILDNGKVRYYYVSKVPVKDKLGRIVGISGTVIDITDYKHEQQELAAERERIQNLEIANRVKQNFIKNISHNLRTPLMGILGASVMNVEEFDQFKMYTKDLELFKYSAELLLNIVDEMIEMEDLLSGNIKLVKKPFKLFTLIRFIDGLFNHICKENGVLFQSDIAGVDQQNVVLEGDFNKLLQMITKVLIYTLRFTSHGSKITVTFRSTFIAPNIVQLFCTIHTSGSAIPEIVSNRMFLPHTETDERDVLEHANAIGLEMFVVKRLMDAFKGHVSYKAVEDGGTFHLDTLFHVAKVSPAGEPMHDLSDLKVLIADDNKVNQLVLKKMVSRLNITDITIVDNGKKAVDSYISSLESEPFKLILMDIQMPEMNGIDATRSIRRHEKDNDLPQVKILAVTAFVTEQDKEECYQAGMDGFLGKPVTQSILADVIVDIHMDGDLSSKK